MAKILVVENNESNANVIALILESNDFTVDCIGDSSLLSDKLASFRPDLILMDVQLDTDDGRVLCDSIKNHSDIPIVLITALPPKEVSKVPCKADDIIYKPFEMDELIEKVEHQMF